MTFLAVIKHDVLALAVNNEGSVLAVEDLDSVLVSNSRSTVSSVFIIGFFVKGDNTFLVVLDNPFFSHHVFVHSCGLDDLLGRGLDNWLGLFLYLGLFFRGSLSGGGSRSSL